jgi:hypothetical protein
LLLRRLDLLLINPKRSGNYIFLHIDCSQVLRANIKRKKLLFKTNKIRNTTIKNSNWSGGDGEHWSALARGGVNEGDGWHNTLESGRKWPKLLHKAEKHLKKTQKTRRKRR